MSLICQLTSEDIKQHYLPTYLTTYLDQYSSAIDTNAHILFCFSCCCGSQHCRGHGNEDRERGCGGGGGDDGDDSFNPFTATVSLETNKSAKSEPPLFCLLFRRWVKGPKNILFKGASVYLSAGKFYRLGTVKGLINIALFSALEQTHCALVACDSK